MASNNFFKLNLDTTGPAFSASIPAYSKAANVTVTINNTGNWISESGTTSDVAYMKVWFTNNDNSITATCPATPTWEPFSATKTVTLSAEGVYTAHVILMDDVGNEVTNTTGSVNYDKTAPTISTFTITDPTTVSGQPSNETNTLSGNKISITASDGPSGTASGITKFTITSNALNSTTDVSPTSGNDYSGTINLKAGLAEGSYTFTVVATDKAGNQSATKTYTLYYDPDAKNTKLELFKESSYTNLLPTSPSMTNYTTAYARIVFTGTNAAHKDIVGYKIWGYTGVDTKPSSYTTVVAGTSPINIGQISISGEGTKTVNVEVIDHSGNVNTLTYTVIVDTTKPTISLTTNKTTISNVSGSNTATLTFSVHDTGTSGAVSGIASYKLTCNGTTVTSGSAAIDEVKYYVTSATDGMIGGTNEFILTATDNAGNTITSNVVNIVLDTATPTASITSPTANTWYKAHPAIILTPTKSCTAYFWVDQNATNTATTSENATSVTLSTTTTSTTISDNGTNIDWGGLRENDTNYLHIKLVDNVGNTTTYVIKFGYDITNPSNVVVGFGQSVYGSTAATITATATDNLGVTAFMIVKQTGSSSDITSATGSWVAWSAITSGYAVTLSTGDGIKKVYLKVKDAAGNESSIVSAECELDTTAPTGSLVLRDHGTVNAKKNPSNVAAVDLYITLTDDTITTHGTGYYKVWGAIKGGASVESAAEWVAFSTGGSTNITLAKECTTGDGTKTFYVKVKDNAGHESGTYSASFVYDTTAPVVYASSDYTKVSKIHTLRKSSATETIADKYCDQIIVTAFMGDGAGQATTEKYKAYKAVAYANATAAASGSAADAAIPDCSSTTMGSGQFTITITGANFEKALNNGNASTTHALDGTHIVVIYVQDEAGTWSAKADFTA